MLPRGSQCFLSVIVVCMLVGCAMQATPLITQDVLLEQIQSHTPPVIIDVRTPHEFSSGHIPGALNIPIQTFKAQLSQLDPSRNRPIVVYCERGVRARRAEKLLAEAGFTQVFHLEGDLQEWRRRSYNLSR